MLTAVSVPLGYITPPGKPDKSKWSENHFSGKATYRDFGPVQLEMEKVFAKIEG